MIGLPTMVSEERLENSLRKRDLLSSDQWRIAKIEADRQQKSLREVLSLLGFVSESLLIDLDHMEHVPILDLSTIVIDPRLRTLIPRELAERHKVLPLFQEDSVFHCAMVFPKDLLSRDVIRHHVKGSFQFAYYQITSTHFHEGFSKLYDYDCSLESLFQEMDKKTLSLEEEGYANPTVRLAHSLLLEAVHSRASDIHLEPEQFFIRVRHRVDGNLLQKTAFHIRHWKALCVRLKWMAGLDIAETRIPQSGRFPLNMAGRVLDCRLSTHPTYFGENTVIRLLDKTQGIQKISTLGFMPSTETLLKSIAHHPDGLVVVTGPTGSGKTTTLYSLLAHRQSLGSAIMTLEQPIEYQLPFIRQTEILENGRLTFAEGIRSILRQDPDVLLVGETRDHETAQAVIRAAMTGHQVYTTLHVGESLDVIQRFVDLGVPLEDLLPRLSHIIHQRLVRRCCTYCKNSSHIPSSCGFCKGTGFYGRIPLVEIVVVDEILRSLFLKKQPHSILRLHLEEKGFQTLSQQAFLLIQNGETTTEEVQIVLGNAGASLSL